MDCLYALLWFTAWVCVASYVAQGKAEGKSDNDNDNKDNKDSDSNKSGCDAWKYGSASKCNISTATVIIGVVILYVPRDYPGRDATPTNMNSFRAACSSC